MHPAVLKHVKTSFDEEMILGLQLRVTPRHQAIPATQTLPLSHNYNQCPIQWTANIDAWLLISLIDTQPNAAPLLVPHSTNPNWFKRKP